jgi:radical SAM superfamily enzyme YgiQ (UPF0313 family)
MRALLVQAGSPPTYWGYQKSLPFIGKAATLPPLGLATLAALLPERWELRIRDANLGQVPDGDLRWADVVLVSGMLVQAPSMREVLARARRLGKRTVAGGPAPTTSPDSFPEADHVFQGEAEGRLALLVEALEAPGRPAPRILSPADGGRPDLGLARVPRFDLLDLDRYASQAIQVSRGCPFQCEFCDIIEIFGRVPRVKSPEQVLAELDALRRLGARGPLFFVDDNFIGNRRAIAALLPRIAEWQRTHGQPFDVYTESSMDLAAHPALVEAMVAAGFSAVFLGIETPSAESLVSAGKRQNLRVDQATAVELLTRAGLEVFAGFIVGFDTDGPDIFDRQIDFVSSLPVPRAMVGLLTALPGTALWRRLQKEGRLRGESSGDQFDRTNFETVLDEEALLLGYRRILAELYAPEAYYARCARHLDLAPHRRRPLRRGSLAALARAVLRIGVASPRRWLFWRLVLGALRRAGPAALPPAVTLAILGEHFVGYTEETALPRLDAAIARLRATPRAVRPAPEAAGAIVPGRAVAAAPDVGP